MPSVSRALDVLRTSVFPSLLGVAVQHTPNTINVFVMMRRMQEAVRRARDLCSYG